MNLTSYTEIVDLIKKGATLEVQERIMALKAFANQTIYPHNTIHGTCHSIDEEMPIHAEMDMGWNEGAKEDKINRSRRSNCQMTIIDGFLLMRNAGTQGDHK